MDGRAFLVAARHLLALASEEGWRSAANRAYYGLLHEGEASLRRWGFPKPAAESIHRFVQRRLTASTQPDLLPLGNALSFLIRLRNHADYQLGNRRYFTTGQDTTQAVQLAESSVALLDQIEADPTRRAAVIAAIRAAFP